MEGAFEEGHILNVGHAALETETGLAAAFQFRLVFLPFRRVLVVRRLIPLPPTASCSPLPADSRWQ